MSARTPFIPHGARPASRAAHLQDQANTQTANSQFSVDSSNPLHAMANSAAAKPPPKNQTDLNSQSVKTNSGPASNGGGHRPLNTGSLLKRKNPASQGHTQNHNTSRRPSLAENAPLRPGTADPNSRAYQEQNPMPNRNNSLNIVAPVPRKAPRPSSPSLSNSLASGVFTTGNGQPMFRMPALPVPSVPQTATDNQPQNDAHISNSSIGFSFSNPHAVSEPQKSQLPSPPTSIRTTSSRPFATADPDIPLPPFSLNMSIPTQSGPQRVLLNPDGTRGQLAEQNSEADEGRLTSNKTGSVLKRSRAEVDADSDHQAASGDYKRYRNQEDVYHQREKSITSHHSSPEPHSVQSRNLCRTPEVPTHDTRPYQHQHPLTPPDNEGLMQDSYHNRHQQHNSDQGPRALDKLLGCDVDMFVEEHAEQYERAIGRWKQCTMAEWLAGADEQAARYSKILDFVKDHMTAKMKLFASFDAKVDGHNAVLDGREKTLEAVKGRLVQESANVLGTGR